MGHPSDQRLSARRPGKNERLRVKKPFRGAVYSAFRDHATGDLIQFSASGGKKKMREAMQGLARLQDLGTAMRHQRVTR